MSARILRPDIIDELDFDPSIGAPRIGVAVDDGTVILTGHVVSDMERVRDGWITLTGEVERRDQTKEAHRAIERPSGVAGLVNAIEAAPRANPADVRSKVGAALERDAEADANPVTVRDPKVIPEGKVHARHEPILAGNAA